MEAHPVIFFYPTDFHFVMPISAINKVSCPNQRAGIAKIWATECENVSDLTFDDDHQVDGITMNGGATFKLIEFEKNTAFFNQTKTRSGQALNVAQQVQFILAGLDVARRKALYDLNQACCMHAIVKTNGGQYYYAGITYFPDSDTWESEDMQTGDGSWNTGADPVSDKNETIEALACNVAFYTPFFGLAEASIPV